MHTNQWIPVIVTIVVCAAIILALLKARQTQRLRARFGPEYRRAIEESGSTIRGEAQLSQREKRVERFNIRPLSATARLRFVETWRHVQTQFVDDPEHALTAADGLVGEVMTARGYPVIDFDHQAADLSVNHALVVEHYRMGHQIALRHGEGRASTEDLRQAMIHYRELFADLVGEPELAHAQAVPS